MLLLTIAAFAQTGALDLPPRDAALMCAAATQQATRPSTVRLMSQVSYYVTAAVRADPGEKPFHQRYLELLGQVTSTARRFVSEPELYGHAVELAAECDRRWPLARSQEPARLPDSPIERDFLCATMLHSLVPAARGLPPGGAPPLEQLEPAFQTYWDRLGPNRERPGILNLLTMYAFGQNRLVSLEIGNAETISRACIAELHG